MAETEFLEALHSCALHAVHTASILCRKIQSYVIETSQKKKEKKSTDGVLEKEDLSPVTIADFSAQAIICKILGDKYPDIPVIAEEGSDSIRHAQEGSELHDGILGEVRCIFPDATYTDICNWIDRGNAREYSDLYWALDPIDGTMGYLRGGQYALALGLVREGKVELGVLGCPNIGMVLGNEPSKIAVTLPFDISKEGISVSALKNRGVFVAPLIKTTRDNISVTSLTQIPSIPIDSVTEGGHINLERYRFCESFESGHSDQSWSKKIASNMNIIREPLRIDSQVKYAVLALKAASVYLRLPRPGYQEKIWDHVAGSIVVKESGGSVCDVNGKELDFTCGYKLSNNEGIVASQFSEDIHECIIMSVKGV